MADTSNTRKRFKGELTIGQVQEEKPVSRSSKDLTFFVETVEKSWTKVQEGAANPAFGMVIPSDGQTLAETRFREAAQQLGLGVSIQVYEADSSKGREKGLAPGQAWLTVQARQRKAAPNTAKKADAPAKKGGLPPIGAKNK